MGAAEITQVLEELRQGRAGAREDLLELVYAELKRLAGAHMRGQPGDHTLQPTALVHEAYLKLLGDAAGDFNDRDHFFAAAGHAMRSILVDHARAKLSQKRGGGAARVTFHEMAHGAADPSHEILAVHEALQTLAEFDMRKARIVELRYFAGLGLEEIAGVLKTSTTSVHRTWRHARLWLAREIGP